MSTSACIPLRTSTAALLALAVAAGTAAAPALASDPERVSVGSDGTQGNDFSSDPALSTDGRVVAFHSYATNLVPGDTNGVYDIFVHDMRTGGTTRVSVGRGGAQGDGDSFGPALSADGRRVAFVSEATNLVAGDTNGRNDVFVHDRRTGGTVRASVGTGGTQANGHSGTPAISADGRVVGFSSDAPNLVPGDTNGRTDVFVRTR